MEDDFEPRLSDPEEEMLSEGTDQKKIPDDLLNVFTYGLIDEPVVAEDGHVYDESSIQAWFQTLKSHGTEVISPTTKRPMGQTLRKAEDAAERLSKTKTSRHWVARRGSRRLDFDEGGDSISSVISMGAIFAAIDPLRDIFKTMDWQPPQIIVLGNEKSGKSTLLERLTMMPVFPKDEEICTRMAIQLRLRRGPPEIPRIEVVDAVTGALLLERFSAIELLHMDVRDEMERLVTESNTALRGVIKDKMLVVHVQTPEAPNLDLLDTPGFVQFGAQDEPENMSAMTREIAEFHINRSAAHSLFLVTTPANENPRTSIGLDIILKKGLQDRTIGVLTKADLCTVNESGAPVASVLRRRLTHANQLAPLRYGYVATMNRHLYNEEGSQVYNYDRLRKQAQNELNWFREHELDDLVAADLGTVGGLVTNLSRMFNEYVRDAWLPSTVKRLREEQSALEVKDMELGRPRAHDEDELNGDALAIIKAEALSTLNSLLDENYPVVYRRFFNEVAQPASEIIATTDFSGVVEYQGIPVRITDMIKNRSQPSGERRAWIESNYQLPLTVQSASFQRMIDKHAKWVTSVCDDAVELAREFYTQRTLELLRGDQSKVKVGRFDALINEVMTSMTALMDEAAVVTRKQLKYLVEAFFRTHPSFAFELKYDFPDAADLPIISVTYRAGSLANTVVHYLVSSGFSTMYAALSDHLPDLVESPAINWTENCAEERIETLKRLSYIEYANRHILKILTIPADELDSIIASLETDHANSTATGPGLEATWPNQVAYFEVQAFNRRGQRQHRGGDRFDVDVSGCPAANLSVEDLKNGCYAVKYLMPADTMEDIVTITVTSGDQHVKGSPFKVRCQLLTDPVKTVASGEGLVTVRPEKEAVFEIVAHNCKGVRQRYGGDNFEVAIPGASKVELEDLKNGTYKVRYMVPAEFREDKLLVHIRLGDRPVSRTPFRVRCERGCLGRFLRQIGCPGNGPGHLQYPYGISIESGLVYVADRNNHRIQVFDKATGGYVRHFGTRGEGNGQLQYPNSVAVDGPYVFVTEKGNHRVQVFNKNTGAYVRQFGSPGSGNGQFQSPYGIAISGAHVYVGDFGNHRVQIFDKTTGGYVSQFGCKGSEPGQLLYPYGVAVSDGLIYVVDFGNHRVQVFDQATWSYVRHFGSKGEGPGELQNPNGVAVNDDYVLVTDGSNHRVCVFEKKSGEFVKAFGSMGTSHGQLQFPDGVALDGDHAFVVDQSNHRVQVFDRRSGSFERQFGSPGNGKGEILFPHGLTVDAKNIYVAEKGNHRVHIFDKATGQFVSLVGASTQSGSAQQLQSPLCVAVDNNHVYVTDGATNRVQIYDKENAAFVRQFGGRGSGNGQFQSIYGIAVDTSFIFVSDYGLHRIQVFDKATGLYLRQFGTPGSNPGQLLKPFGVAVDLRNLYVADNGNYRIQVFDKATGTLVRHFGSAGTGHGQLQSPDAISVDTSLIYVADNSNHRVQVFDKGTGTYVRQFGAPGKGHGQLQNPFGVAVDGSAVYVSDGSHHRVQVFH